jgi:hypothetical protein
VAIGGGVIAVIQVPNVRGSERVLALYQSNPVATSAKLERGLLQCLPEIDESRLGKHLAKTVIVPYYVRVLQLRKQENSAAAVSAEMKKWFLEDHPELWKSLPDRDFLQLASHLRKVGDDSVENCILHATAFGDDVSGLTAARGNYAGSKIR